MYVSVCDCVCMCVFRHSSITSHRPWLCPGAELASLCQRPQLQGQEGQVLGDACITCKTQQGSSRQCAMGLSPGDCGEGEGGLVFGFSYHMIMPNFDH